ncbi:DUF6471 domain-containing protein [Sulfurovum lithotrophicum]|uniref:DUF6471 domain-containing protein n=1 Tax=Sulfurovum lithotrophicum TaxID=206403 RepID=UPI001CB71382
MLGGPFLSILCKFSIKQNILSYINSIVTKVSRGTFSFAFFLECMYALDTDLRELDF